MKSEPSELARRAANRPDATDVGISLTGRRAFLGALGAGLGAWVIHPACLRAAEKTLKEISFVVVTDTRLGYKDAESAGKLWERTAAEIEAAPGAFVLHLGDVVDGGREAQYPVYLETRKVIRK